MTTKRCTNTIERQRVPVQRGVVRQPRPEPHKPQASRGPIEREIQKEENRPAVRDVLCMILKERGHFEHFFGILLIGFIQISTMVGADLFLIGSSLTGMVLMREFLVFFCIER